MTLRDRPIQYRLMRVILITCGTVMFFAFSILLVFEYISFRRSLIQELSIQGNIIAANSTAALAFNSPEDAYEIVSSLQAQPNIVEANLYDQQGELFSHYPENLQDTTFVSPSSVEEFRFEGSHLIGVVPIKQGDNQLGTLFIKSNLDALYDQLVLYLGMAFLVIAGSALVGYSISRQMQKGITGPVLDLATTAMLISTQKDYSVRAAKRGNDEIGLLTDALNQMLAQIQEQNQEIKTFNVQLEEKIEERTSQLEAVNKELESFSYSVSHDLRAPLRSIDGYSNILLEDYGEKIDEEGKRVLDIVISSARKMGDLIDDLLGFSRLGKKELVKVNVNMNSLVSNVLEDIQANSYPKKAEIVREDLPSVQGDISMLKQVMTNLISNALKYSMKKDNAAVKIGSYKDDGHHVYYVRDNGAGFDMQFYDKLFGVFQRLHSENEFEGTGVGLALVQRIVKKHSGKVWAEGKVNEGATFYFSLPGIKDDIRN